MVFDPTGQVEWQVCHTFILWKFDKDTGSLGSDY